MNGDRGVISVDPRRREFLRGLADDFTVLRAREGTWHDEIQERLEWDHTLADDLESE